jgi:hypothetical protein
MRYCHVTQPDHFKKFPDTDNIYSASTDDGVPTFASSMKLTSSAGSFGTSVSVSAATSGEMQLAVGAANTSKYYDIVCISVNVRIIFLRKFFCSERSSVHVLLQELNVEYATEAHLFLGISNRDFHCAQPS